MIVIKYLLTIGLILFLISALIYLEMQIINLEKEPRELILNNVTYMNYVYNYSNTELRNEIINLNYRINQLEFQLNETNFTMLDKINSKEDKKENTEKEESKILIGNESPIYFIK
jgi:hypothetical protein